MIVKYIIYLMIIAHWCYQVAAFYDGGHWGYLAFATVLFPFYFWIKDEY